MAVWNRGPLEWAATALATSVCVACGALGARLFALRLAAAQPGPAALPAAATTLRAWVRGGVAPSLEGWVGVLQAAVLFCAALTVVLHGFDARYRGFDWALFAPPAVAAALLWGLGLRRGDDAVEERWLAAVLLAGAAVMAVAEGPANLQALGYAALMAVLGACAWARASTSRPSSAPTAAGS
jgi:hypothetical protein